jgi:hypothetical protein
VSATENTTTVPGNAELIDKTSYAAMRVLRRPFVTVHEITFYALIIRIVAIGFSGLAVWQGIDASQTSLRPKGDYDRQLFELPL